VRIWEGKNEKERPGTVYGVDNGITITEGVTVVYQLLLDPKPSSHPILASGNRIENGQGLGLGQIIYASNRMCSLELDNNGNLVVNTAGRLPWSSGTAGQGVKYCMLLGGELFLYDENFNVRWKAGTYVIRPCGDMSRAFLECGNDGQVAILRDYNGQRQSFWFKSGIRP
jgi:hypothetical protein